MAITITDVTVISVSAVGTNLITSALPDDARNTIRIIEIVGGLMMAQLAKKPNIKAGGAGIMTGALVGFVDDLLGISKVGQKVSYPLSYTDPAGYYYSYNSQDLILPSDYCELCQNQSNF